MEDVLDIIHKIDFEIEEQKLDNLTKTLQNQTSEIGKLTQRNADYARLLKKMSYDEVEGRSKIIAAMGKNKEEIDRNRKALEQLIFTDKKFQEQLTKEQGVIGALETKLKLLQQRRKQALDPRDYDRSISEIKNKLKDLNTLDGSKSGGGGLFGSLRLGANGITGSIGAVSRMVPMIGGALSVGAIGSQIFDVTKKFEGYIQTLKNAYQSSTQAQVVFDRIQQFAAKTPYSVDELTASFIKLKNRGFDPTTEEMTKMGDLAASQGKSFDQYVEAILDAQTGEYERLKEFGIKAKTAGDTVTLSFKGIEKQVKKTDQEAIRGAIISFGEMKGVMGGMAGQATTLNGKISNMGDSWDMLMNNMGKKGKGVFSELIDYANELLSVFVELSETSPAEQIREEQAEINALFSAVASLNKESAVRNNLIAELNAKYPQLVSNMNLEAMTGSQVLAVLQGINQAYERRINLAQQTAIAEKVAKDQAKTFSDAASVLGSQSFYNALQATGMLGKYQAAAGNTQAQKAIVDQAIQKSGDLSFFGKTDPIGTAYSLRQGSKALDLLNKEVPGLIKRQQAANQGVTKVKAENQKLFDNLYGRVKRAGGIAADGSVKPGFDLRKTLGWIGMGDFQTMLDEGYGPKPNAAKSAPASNSGKPPRTSTKNTPAKGETYAEKQLKIIDEAENKAVADEEKRNADYIKLQNDLLQKKEISEIMHQKRTERNKDVHEQKLLNISLTYNRQRTKYAKGADLYGINSDISQDDEKLSTLGKDIRQRAEKEIDEALSTFDRLNEEILKAGDDSFANEMAILESQHQQRIRKLQEDREKEVQAQVAALDAGQVDLAEQHRKNAQKIQEIEAAENEKFANEKAQKELANELKALDQKTELRLNAIDQFTERERLAFVQNYLFKEDQNQKELDQLRKKGK